MPPQVIDTGLDETSCFFVHDEAGDQIAHGYYYDEMGANFISISSDDDWSFLGDDDDSSFRRSTSAGAANQPNYYTSYYSDYQSEGIFSGGDFSAFPDRRKVTINK